MARLDDIICDDLLPEGFERFPVWAWDDSMEYYSPVDPSEPLPDDEGTLFIRSSFIAPGGEIFTGYLVGLDTYYAFELFVGEHGVGFNLTLPNLAAEDIIQLRNILGQPDFELFPLRYESPIKNSDGELITGVFRADDFGELN